MSFSYRFKNIGEYIVTLTSRSPSGNIDSDSKTITIESKSPIANILPPKNISSEKPNTFLFDASQSYDPDTNDGKNLTFRWNIDGKPVTLDNSEYN